MAKHVCPWWVGYLLISPLRRWRQNPDKILAPYVREGMTVLDIGPGMGFFTIPAAQMVGENGKIIAVDVQERMLRSLIKRATKAGMADRVETHVCTEDDIGVSEPVDLCLAFNVAHEVPDTGKLFSQIRDVLKPSGTLLLAEPKHHISKNEFRETVKQALAEGFEVIEEPAIKSSRSVVLSLS